MSALYLTSSAWGPSYGDPSKYNDISKWKDTIKNNENNAEGTRFSLQRSSRKNSFDMTLVGNDHDYDLKETMYRHNWPHYLVENFESMFFQNFEQIPNIFLFENQKYIYNCISKGDKIF